MTAFSVSKTGVRQSIRRERIRQFTPNWYAATMGTGILAICLGQFPAMPGLHMAGEALWLANILLFSGLTVLYAGKWLLHPREALRAFEHPVVSMFFGCIPMGLATIINGMVLFGVPLFGAAAASAAAYLWWADAGLAVLAGLAIPFAMFTRQEHAFDEMSAVWLLPIVACEVTAASGGLLLPHIAGAAAQMTVLFASYVLWACSVPLALGILTILFLRMALHKLPPAGMAATAFLALGPIGTGALGMLLLGADAPAIFAANGLPGIGEIAAGLGLVAGITLWGFGLWWMLIALLITLRYLRVGIPFNLGWWGFTFPLGVYSLATLKLASTLNLTFFSAFGGVLVVLLAVMWLIVAKRTVQGAWRGELFVSPCIAGLKK
jgi:C4-dicarboxylate transporter/malic acid transport protein